MFMVYITKLLQALLPLHISMKEHDNIMDENKQRKSIEFDI